MKTNQLQDCLECFFNHSPWPFYLRNDLVSMLGGSADSVEETLFGGSTRYNFSFFPRQSSRERPYTPTDWEYMLRNHAERIRRWQWNPSCIVGNTRYSGYGYWTDDGFQFWNLTRDQPDGKPINGRSVY